MIRVAVRGRPTSTTKPCALTEQYFGVKGYSTTIVGAFAGLSKSGTVGYSYCDTYEYSQLASLAYKLIHLTIVDGGLTDQSKLALERVSCW